MTTPIPPTYRLQAFTDGGVALADGILPAWSTFKLTTLFNQGGVLEFEYAIRGENYDKLLPQRRVAVIADGLGEIDDSRCIIDDINGNVITRDGELYRKFTAHSLWALLDEMVIRPTGSYNKPKVDGRIFKDKNAGQILNNVWADLLAQNQLQFIDKDWTGLVDSNGNAWTTQNIDVTFPYGWTFRQVINWLIERGDIDVRFDKDIMQVYNHSGLNQDLTGGSAPVVVWAGESTLEIPEETNTENLWTALMLKGKDNRIWYYEDAAGVSSWRRKTAVLSDDNVETTVRADKIKDRFFAKNTTPFVTRNVQYTVSGVAPHPYKHFQTGDNIWLDIGGQLIAHSVQQIDLVVSAGSEDQSGVATLTLGKRYKTTTQSGREALNSATVTGVGSVSGGAPYVPLLPRHDDILPAQATAPIISSNTVIYTATDTFVEFVAAWAPVTLDEMGEVLLGLDHYEVNWKYTSDTEWQAPIKTRDLTIRISPVQLNREIHINIRAVDFWANAGPASVDTIFTTANDTTPPPVPTTPVLTTRLGTVTVNWDGAFVAAAPRPIDMHHVEVHRSFTTGFTPSAATLAGEITDKTFLVFGDLTYNTPIYVKFIAVDRVGNKSAASTQATATTQPLVNTDIIGQIINGANIVDGTIVASDKVVANSITAAQIAALTITAGQIATNTITADRMVTGTITAVSAVLASASVVNATIANLAVTDAKINDLTATKITAGNITATIGVTSGKFQTAASGARVEMTSGGYICYDGSNVKTFEARTFDGLVTIRGNITIGGGATVFQCDGGTTFNVDTSGVFDALVAAGLCQASSFQANGAGGFGCAGSTYAAQISTNGGTVIGAAVLANGNLQWITPTAGGSANVNAVLISGSEYRLRLATSTLRHKRNIQPLLTYAAEQILGLEPKTFQRNDEPDLTADPNGITVYKEPSDDDPWYPGFIAEEADALGLYGFVSYEADGRTPMGFSYDHFAAVAHQVVLRDHESRIKALEAALANQGV